VVFQVLADSPTTHKLEVKADSGNAVTESNELNNSGTETTTVTSSLCTACIDLVAGGILDTPDPVSSGGSLTYIATVSNAGDTSTVSVGLNSAEVLLLLDGTKLTLGAYSATAGFTCIDFAFAGLIFVDCVGDLGPGQGVAVTVHTTVTASSPDTVFATVLADP